MDKDLSKFDKSEIVQVIEWLGAVLLLITRCQNKQTITVNGIVGWTATDQSGYPGWPLSPTIHTEVSELDHRAMEEDDPTDHVLFYIHVDVHHLVGNTW